MFPFIRFRFIREWVYRRGLCSLRKPVRSRLLSHIDVSLFQFLHDLYVDDFIRRLTTEEKSWSKSRKGTGKWISVELLSHRSVERRLGSSNCAMNPTYRCASAEFLNGRAQRERQHRHPSTRLSRFSKTGTVHRNRRESRNASATAEFYRAFTWKPSSTLSKEVPELTPFELVFHSKYRPSKPDRYLFCLAVR